MYTYEATAEEVLPHLKFEGLPDGHFPIEAIIIIKSMDDNGHVVWLTRESIGLTLIEQIGALTATLDMLRKEQLESWDDD